MSFRAIRILLGLLVLAGLLVWLSGSEPALRWSAAQAQRLSDGRLSIQAVQGSLHGPLSIGALVFQTDEKRFELEHLELDWSPLALLGGQLRIKRLALRELKIIERKPGGPLVLPETLHFPLRLSAPSVTVERVIFPGGATQPALSGIDLGLESASGHYRLKLRAMAGPWGNAIAEARLDDSRPFRLQGHARLWQTDGPPYRANARFSGDLAQLVMKAKVSILGGQASIDAQLLPFEQSPLLKASLAAERIDLAMLGKGLPQTDLRATLDASLQNGVIELRQAALQSGAGRLALHGSLALTDAKPFRLTGNLQNFNPADWGQYPVARIQAELAGEGQLAADPWAAVTFTLTDSRLHRHAFSGQGRLTVSTGCLRDTDIALRLAGNRLLLRGALGRAGDRLDFELQADDLARLDTRLAGRGRATGTLQGSFAAPYGTLDAQFRGLAWDGQIRIAQLRAQGRLMPGADGPLALTADLQGLASPQLDLDQAEMQVQGTRARHTLRLSAKGSAIDAQGQLAGGWREGVGWSGQLTRLDNRGPFAFSLQSPADLEFAGSRLRLGRARLKRADADLILHELAYQPGRFASSGEFRQLPLADLLKISGAKTDFKTDLALAGNWRIAVQDAVNGHLAAWREQGDVSFPGLRQSALGLERLTLSADAVDNRLQGRLDVAGTNLGSLKAELQSRLSRRKGVWGLGGDAPVQGHAEFSADSLAWTWTFFGRPDAPAIDGALQASVHIEGTFAQPQLGGSIQADRLSLALPDQGLRFTEGRLRAELQDQVLHIREIALRGGEGRLTGQGQIELGGLAPALRLSLQADRLTALSRPDRWLILSGTGEVSAAGREIRIAGKLKAEQALILLPKIDAPTLSDDIVVLGRPAAQEAARAPYTLHFDLDADLGERFLIKGKGLDAQLGGKLHLAGGIGAPLAARGGIRIVKGDYAAYGQRLQIERGLLNFQGPIDNPGIDILAMRKHQPVEAGVAVTGTAQSPTVRLVSRPEVPDGQKLSWLVLGHGIDDTSGAEFSALQAAANALLATDESITLQQSIAQATGLEEVSLKGTGGLETTVLTLGKRLSSRAYLSYEQGIAGASTLVNIHYTLSKRLSIRTQAGDSPAVDLFYSFSFD